MRTFVSNVEEYPSSSFAESASCSLGRIRTPQGTRTLLRLQAEPSPPPGSTALGNAGDLSGRPSGSVPQSPSTYAKIRGATIIASELMLNRGVPASSLPQVIFSLAGAPE